MSKFKQMVVKAVDVGYGNVKYTSLITSADVQCGIFPSIAPQISTGPDMALGLLQKRNTVEVEVNGVRYEVGKDARLAQDATHGRILDSDYSMTDTHLALLRGALFYMGAPEIDLLVLGLPVNTHQKYAAVLAKKMTGRHPVPFKGDGPQECVVHNVHVLPQPIGAFYDHTSRTGTYDKMRQQMNLLIDVGYFTLDWVVAAGSKVNTARSGATNGGMSAVLRAITDSIAKDLQIQISDVSLVEDAIRNKKNPEFFGKEVALESHKKVGKTKADVFVNTLATKVGENYDISNIIMTGGGAEFFRASIEEKFPRHNIIMADSPVFANVRGFYKAGAHFASMMAKSA